MSPLVFLHGFLGTGRDWSAVLSHLPPCETLCLNLPGHGGAPFTPTFTLPPDLHYPIHLIGYSMGGRLALQWAARHPHLVASLTLLSTHPGLTSEEARRKKWEEDCLWARRLLTLPIDEFLKAWYDQPLFCPPHPMRTIEDRESMARALLHYSGSKLPVATFAGAYSAVGERDLIYRKLLPHATVIPGGGHAIHLQNPKGVAEFLRERIFR